MSDRTRPATSPPNTAAPDRRALHAAVLDGWLAGHPSPNTRSAYRADLEVFGRWCEARGTVPLNADARALVAFQGAREAAGDSPSTLRRRWSALSSFFQSAVAHGARDDNPVDGAARPKVASDDPTSTALLSQRSVDGYRALANSIDPRLAALVSLIALDGLKLGEALALDVDDVSGRPPRMAVTIPRRGVRVQVILGAESADAVRTCAGPRRTGPLFTSARGAAADQPPTRLTRFGADHLIRQLNTTDDDRVTANALRRFHSVSSQAAGTDVESIRERMGLADVRSVRRHLPSE